MIFKQKQPLGFRARSSQRDEASDKARLARVQIAIAYALSETEKERNGLSLRLKDVLSLASLTVGNDVDEYRTRETSRDEHLQSLDADIKYAEGRLTELERQIIALRNAAALF